MSSVTPRGSTGACATSPCLLTSWLDPLTQHATLLHKVFPHNIDSRLFTMYFQLMAMSIITLHYQSVHYKSGIALLGNVRTQHRLERCINTGSVAGNEICLCVQCANCVVNRSSLGHWLPLSTKHHSVSEFSNDLGFDVVLFMFYFFCFISAAAGFCLLSPFSSFSIFEH